MHRASPRALAGGFALAVAIGWNFVAVGAVATELAADYAVSLATVGLLTTVVVCVTVVLQLPVGRRADRSGPRLVGLAGCCVLVLGNLVPLGEARAWEAFAGRAVVGVGLSLAFVTGIEYLRRAGATALAQGIYGGATGAGSGLALALVPQLDGWLSPATAGAAGSLALLGWIVTRPLSGWIVHSRPGWTRGAIALSIVLGALGTAALALAGPVALAVAGSALVGLASGVPWTYAVVAAGELRPDAPATAVALVNMTGLVVIAIGIQLVGLSFALPGDGRIGFAVVAVLWASSIFFLPHRVERSLAAAAPPSSPG